MTDHVLRGTRLGAVSHEPDRSHDLAARRDTTFACPTGHQFDVPFAEDAEIPSTWECRQHGTQSTLVDGTGAQARKPKPRRTHRDMLLERRTVPELEDLLAERLEQLRTARRRTT